MAPVLGKIWVIISYDDVYAWLPLYTIFIYTFWYKGTAGWEDVWPKKHSNRVFHGIRKWESQKSGQLLNGKLLNMLCKL